jgi:hypothetical protein
MPITAAVKVTLLFGSKNLQERSNPHVFTTRFTPQQAIFSTSATNKN